MYSKYWKSLSVKNKENLALKTKTSVVYLRLIMQGHKKAGFKLALRLDKVTNGEVSISILRPDMYPPKVSKLDTLI